MNLDGDVLRLARNLARVEDQKDTAAGLYAIREALSEAHRRGFADGYSARQVDVAWAESAQPDDEARGLFGGLVYQPSGEDPS